MSHPLQAITFRLNGHVESDREMHQRYRDIPRSRRQEWMRTVMQLGIAVLDGNVASAPIVPVKASVAVAASASTVPRALDRKGTTGTTTTVEPPISAVTPAEALKGFFGGDSEM